MKLQHLRTLAPLLLVAGCASTPDKAPPVSAPAQPSESAVGLEAVMGANARSLTAMFGTPDLDVREGTAQKLQFSSTVCVMDTYLYPRSNGAEAVVTHVDARTPDGRDFDRASCVAAIRAKRQVR